MSKTRRVFTETVGGPPEIRDDAVGPVLIKTFFTVLARSLAKWEPWRSVTQSMVRQQCGGWLSSLVAKSTMNLSTEFFLIIKMSQYQYRQLHGHKPLRLLNIPRFALRNRECTAFELIYTTIQDAPQFETVSYTWGDWKKPRKLHFSNGEFIHITENLHQSLPHLLNACQTDYLWIDQLCIDQLDLHERSQQVAIMGEIYATAQRTLVWLGGVTDDINVIRCLIAQLGHKPEGFIFRSFQRNEIKKKQTDLDVDSLFQISTNICHGDSTPQCILVKELAGSAQYCQTCTRRAFQKIFQATWEVMERPWFSRCWVVQEALLSKEVRMLTGHITLSPYDLLRVCNVLYWIWGRMHSLKFKEYDLYSSKGMRPFKFMMTFWERVEDREFSTFTSVLEDMRARLLRGHMKASDPRDIIYSLRNIHLSARTLIQPDYSLKLDEVYNDATRACIEECQDLSILHLCDNADSVSSQEKTVEFPSWVPDWSKMMTVRPISMFEFAACGTFQHTLEPRCVLGQLKVRGKHVGHISTLFSKEWEKFFGRAQNRQPLRSLRSIVRALVEERPHLSSRITEKDLFLLMTCNGVGVGIRYGEGLKYNMLTFNELEFKCCQDFARNRRIALSDGGHLALVPSSSLRHDEIWVLYGCSAPVILRRIADSEYKLIGICYVDGIMYGEAVADSEGRVPEISLS